MSRKTWEPTLLLILCVLCCAHRVEATTPAYVQSNNNVLNQSASSISASFTSNVTAGNTIIVAASTAATTGPAISSVADTQGNTYAQAAALAGNGNAIWYATNVRGGADTVTANFASTTVYSTIYIHEYSGIATSSALDVTASNTGNSTSVTSNPATTTQANELIFGFAAVGRSIPNPGGNGSGFTLRQTNGGNGSEDMVVSQTNSYAATFTQNSGSGCCAYTALMATFKAVVGGGGSGPSISSLSPTTGQVGTLVTITGTNFGSPQNQSTVTFGSIPAAAASTWTATKIIVNVPSGATTGSVVVTVDGMASNNDKMFTVDPVITTQPTSQTVNEGASARFIVSATGSGTLSYQWQKNGTNVPSNGTSAIYWTPPTAITDSGSHYQVVVSDSNGPVTSTSVNLTVNSANSSVPEYSVYEKSLTAAKSYSNPYTDVTVTGTFTPPSTCSGVSPKTIQGFYESGTPGLTGNQFRVRFTPTCTGTWMYSISNTNSDSGLTMVSGSITVVSPSAGEHGFVRRDPANPNHFVYDDGSHYFMLGQTYYNIIENVAGGGTWQTAIQQSQATSFTKVRILLYSWGPVYKSQGVLYNDIIPYLGGIPSHTYGTDSTGDHDQVNLVFWDDLDALVGYLHDQGMVADLILFNDHTPSYGDNTQNARYINYALARLAGQTNVIWCMSNEYDYVKGGGPVEQETENVALANGYSDKGTQYTAADQQMNVLGSIVRNNDPYANSDTLSSAPRVLSVHQHSQAPPPTFLWWNLANTLGANWFTSATIQDHIGYPGNSPYGDVNGNQGISHNLLPSVNGGHNIPIVNDEYGYLDAASNTRTVARNAIWAIIMGGGYGSFGGDEVSSCDSGDCPLFSGDWVPENDYYGDIHNLVQFMSSTSYWAKTTANAKIAIASGARAYASGPASLSTGAYVVYVAQPASSGKSFTFDQASTSTCTIVDEVNPRTNTINRSLGPLTGPINITTFDTTNDWVYHLYNGSCGQ